MPNYFTWSHPHRGISSHNLHLAGKTPLEYKPITANSLQNTSVSSTKVQSDSSAPQLAKGQGAESQKRLEGDGFGETFAGAEVPGGLYVGGRERQNVQVLVFSVEGFFDHGVSRAGLGRVW